MEFCGVFFVLNFNLGDPCRPASLATVNLRVSISTYIMLRALMSSCYVVGVREVSWEPNNGQTWPLERRFMKNKN